MPDETRKTTAGDDAPAAMSSEEIEVRAIEDATSGTAQRRPADGAETEQDIEFTEKRELALDERANDDPTRH